MRCSSLFLLAAASALPACAPRPEVSAASARAAEIAAQARCPRSQAELAALIAVRIAFDVAVAPRLSPDQLGPVLVERRTTDRACGIVTEPEAPAPPAAGPPAGGRAR